MWLDWWSTRFKQRNLSNSGLTCGFRKNMKLDVDTLIRDLQHWAQIGTVSDSAVTNIWHFWSFGITFALELHQFMLPEDLVPVLLEVSRNFEQCFQWGDTKYYSVESCRLYVGHWQDNLWQVTACIAVMLSPVSGCLTSLLAYQFTSQPPGMTKQIPHSLSAMVRASEEVKGNCWCLLEKAYDTKLSSSGLTLWTVMARTRSLRDTPGYCKAASLSWGDLKGIWWWEGGCYCSCVVHRLQSHAVMENEIASRWSEGVSLGYPTVSGDFRNWIWESIA